MGMRPSINTMIGAKMIKYTDEYADGSVLEILLTVSGPSRSVWSLRH